MAASDIHDKVTRDAIKTIIGPILEAGGEASDIMVAGESFIIGLALVCINQGGDESVLEVMFTNAKARLAEIRLGMTETAGEA